MLSEIITIPVRSILFSLGCYENNNFLYLDQNEIAMVVLLQYYFTITPQQSPAKDEPTHFLLKSHSAYFRSKKHFATLIYLENLLQASSCSCYLRGFEIDSKGEAGSDL